ncbi:MAG: acyl-CoA dehydrogenase family protein [Acidobacteria bacterium]|nr:acyl-CoA dehydrogenase family protein [Acidobacteriota bacterium]
MDFRVSEEQKLLRRSIREFAETEIRPHVRAWDAAQHFPRELMPRLAALGLLGIQIPEQYGGAALSAVDYCVCIEELARVDPGVALSVAAHNGLCAAHIALAGTEAQKRTWLMPLATGRKLGAWALTEASSGSDAAGMHTAAVRDGGSWVLNGAKAFITHGAAADVFVIMAATDREAGRGGISAFVVDKGTPGLAAGRKEDKLGMRASETSEVVLNHCRVPAAHLLGEAGRGFADTMIVLDAGRIGIAALAVGLAQGAWEAARAYAKTRTAFGRTIDSFQATQWKLADSATRIEAARLLTDRAAFLQDRGRRTTAESAMAKLYASETAVKAADDCVQIHGGYGFVKDYPAEKFFRDVKLTTIGEGTSEIQRLVIARALLAEDRGRAESDGRIAPRP